MVTMIRTLLLVAVLAVPATAEIQVDDRYEPYQPIIVRVIPSGIPEGAQVRSSITIQNAELRQGATPDTYHVWATPGVYNVESAGVWVLTKDITVGEQVVPVLVDFGQYSESASFEVLGSDPTPPPPPPPPPEEKWIVIVEESSQRSPRHASLYTRLRSEQVAKVVIADQHDQSDNIRRYVEQIPDNAYLPWIFIVDEDGEIHKAMHLPDTTTVDAVKEMLE